MNRCAAGVIVLSWRPSRYQEGMVFQAAAVVGLAAAASASGRCVTAITAASFVDTSPANASRKLAA